MDQSELEEIERDYVRWYPARITAMDPETAWARPTMGLYAHIPYCAHRCHFCKYKVKVGEDLHDEMDVFLDALENEIRTVRERGQVAGRPLNVIFIGGGTPSLLATPQLDRLLTVITSSFELTDDCEFSMEWSPASLSREKLRLFHAAGGNRLSIGVQSFNDAVLKEIGRDHTAAEAREALRLAHEAGFDNINLDLIYRLPGQNVEDVRRSVRDALACDPAHISFYPLWIREQTVLWSRLQKGELEIPGEDVEQEMFEAAREIFEESGYEHYNVFDFVRRTTPRCRYTELQWEDGEWVGVGPSAVTYVEGRHTINAYSIGDYIEQARTTGAATTAGSVLDLPAQMRRTMMFGLRMNPFDTDRFRRQYGVDVDTVFGPELTALTENGLVVRDGRLLRLSAEGIRKVNNIGKLFYTAPDDRQSLGLSRRGLPIVEVDR
ncbi:oxygen-independent coproporphyrinogen-3 oxidase [Streptomyces sp. LBL]|uniref:radical SAM family heme chaperone HemW n=1 Tax=Streptomyces sp. LBL TaxID=2940562 RepID=UPI0024733F55|nr:radical SAM family heme chaperone HemW [Streptomyces sp. LBL]MDH6623235.1 oxygen-independent coproporphyrinogen-3 oxidase [Streptomyces sp. LBL]